MRFFCEVAIDTAEVESAEAQMDSWREKKSWIVLGEDVNKLEDARDVDEVEAREGMSETDCVEMEIGLTM